MKLVPESWYKKIMALNTQKDVDLDIEDKLKDQKTRIFGDSGLSDDVKILLLQNLNRQLIDKKNEDSKQPLLVKNVDKDPVPTLVTPVRNSPSLPASILHNLLRGTTTRGSRILNFLKENGAIISEDKVDVGGVSYSIEKMNSSLITLCSGVSSKSASKSDPVLMNLLKFIRAKKPPLDLFPASINSILQKQTGSGKRIQKTRPKVKRIKKWTRF